MRRTHSHDFGHGWWIGLAGVAAGLVLLVYVPSLKPISSVALLFGMFHLIGAGVVVASVYAMGVRNVFRKLTTREQSLDFGWTPGWMSGLSIAAVVAASAGVVLQLVRPNAWPISFLLVAQSVVFLVGSSIMRSFRRIDQAVLPMVELVPHANGTVLDAGCGAGRTSIAVARALPNVQIVAVDRFDASYIEGGGKTLLARNLAISGVTERVHVETTDLTELPFEDASLDAAVSTNVFDHLGNNKDRALQEMYRVLKPGARFLMVVWVPGWSMFTVGNVFALFFTSKKRWMTIARNAGFLVKEEGVFNSAWFLLLERPAGQRCASEKVNE